MGERLKEPEGLDIDQIATGVKDAYSLEDITKAPLFLYSDWEKREENFEAIHHASKVIMVLNEWNPSKKVESTYP